MVFRYNQPLSPPSQPAPADRTQYNCDVRSICWDIYMTTWAHGMKVFLLKEAPVLSVPPRSRCPQELSRL